MATLDDLRQIAASLPGATFDDGERIGIAVQLKGKSKGIVWAWMERVHPVKPKVINNGVIAIVVPSLSAKEVILSSSDPNVIFTEDHYNGYPAVLVHLDRIDVDTLSDLVIEAWRCKAHPDLVREFDNR